MIARKPLFLGPFVLAAAGLTACASMLGGEPVKIRPVQTMSSLTPAQGDPLYESAVTAIDDRDYARALDYLQQAKAENPKNIKVLNALGVVYDKLGRFDLSARYYGQAQAVDPASRIVAANLEYSKVLQGWQEPDQHPSIAAVALPGAQPRSVAQVAAVPSQAETMAPRAPLELTQPITPVSVHPVVVSAPAMQWAALPSPAGSMAPPIPLELAQPITPISAHPATVSAPAIRPAPSSTVVLSISPEVVAPASIDTDKKTAVLADMRAPAPAFTPAPKRQQVVVLTPLVANSGTMTGLANLPGLPASLINGPTKMPAVLPLPAAFITPIARPSDVQLAASLPVPHVAPAASKIGSVAPVRPVAASVSAKHPAILPVRAVTIAPVIHPAEVKLAALSVAPRLVLPSGKPDEKPVSMSPRRPAVVVQDTLSQKRLAAGQPHALASMAPAIHGDKKQLAALPVPAAFHSTIVPFAPVKTVVAAPGNGKVLMIGKPVKILNASGRPGEIGTVSRRLTALGWSVRPFDWRMQPVTTLYYPVKNIVAAKAMLRTLPFPAQFIADKDDSFAMRLVIGRDFLSWKPRNSKLAALWQKGAVVASLQKPLIRGVQ